MTTSAAKPESDRRLAEIDACRRGAWAAYREELRALEGDAYTDAEPLAWERLQATLRELDAERATLVAGDVKR